jgi:hypothetical protein
LSQRFGNFEFCDYEIHKSIDKVPQVEAIGKRWRAEPVMTSDLSKDILVRMKAFNAAVIKWGNQDIISWHGISGTVE